MAIALTSETPVNEEFWSVKTCQLEIEVKEMA
jgi:hypothetical protein